MREVSDRLCREYAISVIENPGGRAKHYAEWQAEQNGKPTHRGTIRADIDRAILASTTERDFLRVMGEMGYQLKTKGKHERDIWDAQTLMKALSLCDDPFLSLAINLAFACSLRMGELLGLTWSCVNISQDSIDHDCAYIYIDKELQRISRESLAQIGEKGIIFKFPTVRGCNSTVLALKEPKTRTSVRKVFLPRTVAKMLVERKKTVNELKELLGDEYRDYDLVFASTQGTPTEANFINRAFGKLITDNDLPKVVFHSLRHTSTTYKLKLSGGDIKAVQGDTGHAQATMVTERYAHILDDDRRVNAARFQKEFYGGGGTVETTAAVEAPREPQAPASDPLQSLDVATKQQLLLKLLAESPDMAALLTALAGRSA